MGEVPGGSGGSIQRSKCLVQTDWEVSFGRSYRNLSLRTAQNSKRARDARCSLNVRFLLPLFFMILSVLSPLFSLIRPPFPIRV